MTKRVTAVKIFTGGHLNVKEQSLPTSKSQRALAIADAATSFDPPLVAVRQTRSCSSTAAPTA